MSDIIKIILLNDNLILHHLYGLFSKIVHFLAYLGHLCPEDVFIKIYLDQLRGTWKFPCHPIKIARPMQKTKFAIFLEFKKWPLFDKRVRRFFKKILNPRLWGIKCWKIVFFFLFSKMALTLFFSFFTWL